MKSLVLQEASVSEVMEFSSQLASELNTLGKTLKTRLGLSEPAIAVVDDQGWKVRCGNVVGFFRTENVAVQIQPKFNRGIAGEWHQTFFGLVNYVSGVRVGTDLDFSASTAHSYAFSDLLGEALWRELRMISLRGLPRRYSEKSGSGYQLKGSLDLANQLDLTLNTGKLGFRYPLLTFMSHENQLIRWAALRMSQMVIDQGLSRKLRNWSNENSGSGPANLPWNWRSLRVSNRSAFLSGAIHIAQTLASGSSVSTNVGIQPLNTPGFAWKTPELFESAVFRIMRDSLKPLGLSVGKQRFVLASQNDLMITTTPDLQVSRNDGLILVGDAKYKDRGKVPAVEDVYQVLSGGNLFDNSNSFIVYPKQGKELGISFFDVRTRGSIQRLWIIDLGMDAFSNSRDIFLLGEKIKLFFSALIA